MEIRRLCVRKAPKGKWFNLLLSLWHRLGLCQTLPASEKQSQKNARSSLLVKTSSSFFFSAFDMGQCLSCHLLTEGRSLAPTLLQQPPSFFRHFSVYVGAKNMVIPRKFLIIFVLLRIVISRISPLRRSCCKRLKRNKKEKLPFLFLG